MASDHDYENDRPGEDILEHNECLSYIPLRKKEKKKNCVTIGDQALCTK